MDSDDAPTHVGTRVIVIRRVGRREMESAAEIDEFQPPSRWGVRGVDGPVRGDVTGTIEPLDYGTRSRVTLTLELRDTDRKATASALRPKTGEERDAAERPELERTTRERRFAHTLIGACYSSSNGAPQSSTQPGTSALMSIRRDDHAHVSV